MTHEKIIGLFCGALKEKCCSDPAEAKRCVMVSEDAFHDAFVSALQAANLAIVPVEPTFDMTSEGGAVIWEHASEAKHQMIIRAYKAMIAEAGK